VKVTKTNVQRLTVELSCGCKAVREYQDPQFKEPIAEAVYSPCERHKEKPDAAEMAEMLLVETLEKEAENAGKTYAPFRAPIEDGDTAGVTATGESVARMGVTNLPKRDPTKIKQLVRPVDNSPRNPAARAAAKKTAAAAPSLATVLNTAGEEVEDGGIQIDEQPEDPRITDLTESALLPDLEDDPDSSSGVL
jgi:hypothetical protein